MNKRLNYLDYTKGLAILLLLLSHSIPHIDVLSTIIFAFHMPVFFLICGYLAYLKRNEGMSILESSGYLKSRERNLFEPYVLFGLCLLCLFCIFDYAALGMISEHTKQRITSWIQLGGIESMWFLPVYFLAEFFFLLSRHYFRFYSLWIIPWIVTVAAFCLLGDKFVGAVVGNQLKNTLVGYVFVVIGYLSARYKIEQRLKTTWAVVLFFCFCLASLRFGFMAIQDMKEPALFFLEGTILSIALLSCFHHLGQLPQRWHSFLSFWGRNTIIVVCTNNIIIEIIRLADYKVSGNFFMTHGSTGDFLFFLLLTCCEALVITLIGNRFPRGKR